VIAQESLADCRAAGAARRAKEAGFFTRLQSGATTVELLSLDITSIGNS
jgi:hypothetical protein